MATKGRLDEFVVGKDSWEEYIERVKFHFTANDVTNASKQRAYLLSDCGSATYSLIRSLCAPKKTEEVTFDEIVGLMNRHLNPRPSEISRRVQFQRCFQRQNQSVTEYVADLRKAADHCNFTDLEDRLRDQMVSGLRDEKVQQRLLTETKLTFKKVLELAIATEAADRNTTEIRAKSVPVETNKVYKASRPTPKFRPTGTDKVSPAKPNCFRCGGLHASDNCRFVNTECRYCQKKGHIERVCLSKIRSKQNSETHKHKKFSGKQNHSVISEDKSDNMYNLNVLKDKTVNGRGPYKVLVEVNGKQLEMEIDSGSAVSVISEETFRRLWPGAWSILEPSSLMLRTWSHQRLELLGTLRVIVNYQGNQTDSKLSLQVVKGSGTSLLGREWFLPLGIAIKGTSVNLLRGQTIEDVVNKYATVFDEKLGSNNGPPVTIEYDTTAQPIFLKSRPVPFAIRDKVDAELDNLVLQGVLEPVRHSQWATPIVPVLKNDGSIRICGDYRATVNTILKPDSYPLPTTTELFASLSGCKKFVKFDMSQAYQQLRLDDTSADLLTLNTTRGLFRVKRLPFGISSAPGIFQRFVDTLTAGLQRTLAYLDDILVGGEDDAEVAERSEELLKRLSESGLRLKKEKCFIKTDRVRFLGFDLDGDGIHPNPDKVEAIHNAPAPQNKEELRAFLGLLNFYDRFLPGKATVLEPLHRLLDEKSPWTWLQKHMDAFKKAKLLLQSERVLVHYDPKRPLVLACDASQYGVGAVLSHVSETGFEEPIAFASRTLSTSERNYAQVQREGLAIIFGVKKFHQFLFGRSFKIITDHKPLLGLFNPRKGIPVVMNPQMLRWSLLLSAYSYDLQFRPGKEMGNADGLSRLPLPSIDCNIPPLGEILMIENSQDIPIDSQRIGKMSQKDVVLSQVYKWVLQGFPKESPSKDFDPYFSRKTELSTYKSCLLWGSRVVIPDKHRKQVLMLLHTAHPGIVHMKSLARSHVWWPGMDMDIEKVVNGCQACQENRHDPSKAPVHHWPWPEQPWTRLHLDFAGPLQGKLFLLVVDAHSKWLEVELVSSTSSAVVIKTLRRLFASHGLPDVVVADNGTAFVSEEFRIFLQRNQIRLLNTPPYHPASNGQAERYVQTTKQALKKIIEGDWETRLQRFLLSQHTIPHSTTGVAPSELLMKRRLRTALDRLHPNLENEIQKGKERITEGSGQKNKKLRMFSPGDEVYARNYGLGKRWIPAIVREVKSPVSYDVQTKEGQLMLKRHIDQLRRRQEVDVDTDVPEDKSVGSEHTSDMERIQEPVKNRRPERKRIPNSQYKDFV